MWRLRDCVLGLWHFPIHASAIPRVHARTSPVSRPISKPLNASHDISDPSRLPHAAAWQLGGCCANLIPSVSAIVSLVVLQVNASAAAPLISPRCAATLVILCEDSDRTKRSAPQREDKFVKGYCKKRVQARRKNNVRDEPEQVKRMQW
jgi:hypothetical protein